MALPRADGVARPTATADAALERRLRRAAAARGLNEAVTWSFLPEAEADHFAEWQRRPGVLANPISEDMKAMRPSLLPGLLAAARRNLDRGATGVRLFEIGRRYLRGEAGASDERLTLGVLLAGEKAPRGWATGKARAFDAFDAKAEALALLAEAGAPVDKLQVMGEAGPQFHPGQSATLRLGPKTVLARFGALHPAHARGVRHRRCRWWRSSCSSTPSRSARAAAASPAPPTRRPRCRRCVATSPSWCRRTCRRATCCAR